MRATTHYERVTAFLTAAFKRQCERDLSLSGRLTLERYIRANRQHVTPEMIEAAN